MYHIYSSLRESIFLALFKNLQELSKKWRRTPDAGHHHHHRGDPVSRFNRSLASWWDTRLQHIDHLRYGLEKPGPSSSLRTASGQSYLLPCHSPVRTRVAKLIKRVNLAWSCLELKEHVSQAKFRMGFHDASEHRSRHNMNLVEHHSREVNHLLRFMRVILRVRDYWVGRHHNPACPRKLQSTWNEAIICQILIGETQDLLFLVCSKDRDLLIDAIRPSPKTDVHMTKQHFFMVQAAVTPTKALPAPHGRTMIPDRARLLWSSEDGKRAKNVRDSNKPTPEHFSQTRPLIRTNDLT